MPKGIYKRTKEHKEILRRNMGKAGKVAWKLPRSLAQIKHHHKLSKLPTTQKKRETWRKIGLNSKGKRNPHGPTAFGNDIVKHHNDLCHGAERPDDIALMTQSEHRRLHEKLRVQNGTHPFLSKNRKKI